MKKKIFIMTENIYEYNIYVVNVEHYFRHLQEA